MLFLFFSFIGRFLFPFGDEPDFVVRASNLVDMTAHPAWSPYYLFGSITSGFETSESCNIDASPFSLWASIDPSSCSESFENISIRFLLLIIVTCPLLLAVVFRRSFVAFASSFRLRLSAAEWQHRLDAVCVSLVFPSVIYYLGVLSVEQATLSLSILLFLFFGFAIPMLLLAVLLISLDFGNALVVIFFSLCAIVCLFVYKNFGVRAVILLLFVGIVFSYIVGFEVLRLLPLDVIGAGAKAEGMYSFFSGSDLVDKYPVILRPVITFMAFVFMTSLCIKTVVAYLIAIYFTVLVARRLVSFFRRGECYGVACVADDLMRRFILLLTGVSVVLNFVFFFPVYAHAKYYIFLMPFVISVGLSVYSRYQVSMAGVILLCVVYINLLLFRL